MLLDSEIWSVRSLELSLYLIDNLAVVQTHL